MASTVPQPYFTDTGLIIPDEACILIDVCNDLNSAFGGNLNLDPINNPSSLSTPQGQLASSIAAIIADKNNLFLQYVTQIDPLTAQGRMQDALGYIYFMERKQPAATTITCVCNGLSGLPIPITAQIQDAGGNVYQAKEAAVIGGDGTVTVDFANIVTGPIQFVDGPIQIYTQIPGWDTVATPTGVLLGNDAETQQEFEFRRKNSVAANAVNTLDAIRAAVLSSGLTLVPPNSPSDSYVVENNLDVTQLVGGVSLKPHSVYVAAEGGDPQSICDAIFSKASNGCNYNGSTTMTVYDTNYSDPNPAYQVSYQIPAQTPIYFLVTLISNSQLPADVATLVKNAIVAVFPDVAKIGATLMVSDFYNAVKNCGPGLDLVYINIGLTSNPTSDTISLSIDKIPTITPSDIIVVLQ